MMEHCVIFMVCCVNSRIRILDASDGTFENKRLQLGAISLESLCKNANFWNREEQSTVTYLHVTFPLGIQVIDFRHCERGALLQECTIFFKIK